jgi:hypothetical protein
MATQPEVETKEQSDAVPVGPDWGAVTEEIHCPLCDYNLRGLNEPRCPECGYRFEWPDLIDPSRRLHPYVFEHHPERNVWSAWKTALGLLRPKRFWKSLLPVQPSRPRRLVAYWGIAGCLLLIFAVLTSVAVAVRAGQSSVTSAALVRAGIPAFVNSPQGKEWLDEIVAEYGSVQAYLDLFYPTSLSAGWVARRAMAALLSESLVFLFLWVWPWVTIASLLVFGISMRRWKVRAVHVMRCALYNQDIVLITAAPLGLLMILTAFGASLVLPFNVELVVIGIPLIVEAIFIYRMTMAYKYYLKFDHPFLTILASQVIAALACPTLLVLAALLLGL